MSRRCSRRRKDKRPRKELRKRRNMNKSRLKRPPVKPAAPPTPCPKTTSNMVWENIVLHYLNKLKNAWKSSKPEQQNQQKDALPDGAVENDAGNWRGSALGKCPPNSMRESKSFTSMGSTGSDCHHVAKQKALNIVKNAIEYGQSKGIISKNGKFFWLRSEMRDSSSDMDPDYKHCTLSECKSLFKKKKHTNRDKFPSECSSLTPSILSKSESKRLRYKDYAKGKAIHPKAFSKRKLRSHFEDDSEEECTCKRCKCKNKMYY